MAVLTRQQQIQSGEINPTPQVPDVLRERTYRRAAPPPAPEASPEAPPEAIPAPQPVPEMPPPAQPPPLGAGTFALPGQGAAAPFRTSNFLSNRFVSGGGQDVASQLLDPNQIGRVPGGSPLAPGGAAEVPNGLSEDEIRRIMAGVLGGR